MGEQWYYVQGSDRIGPVGVDQLTELYANGIISDDSYVWKKGFDNWKFIKDVDELENIKYSEEPEENTDPFLDLPPINNVPKKEFSWDDISDTDVVIMLKVGVDRGGVENEYGPFSISQLKQAWQENRINEKTFIFTRGLDDWVFLGDTPLFQRISGQLPPTIQESERRVSIRRPFVARMFFHNNESVFEGICRDISVGGLQILVSDCPLSVGDMVNLNVHPDNSDYHFVAQGEVVRILDGGRGFSLRFENMTEEAIGAIQEYVSKN